MKTARWKWMAKQTDVKKDPNVGKRDYEGVAQDRGLQK